LLIESQFSGLEIEERLDSIESVVNSDLNKEVLSKISNGEKNSFKLKSLNGDKVSLEDFNGKVLVIDFWATWCGPCINASNYLSVLQNQYPNDLHIISLTKENKELVEAFIPKHNLKLTVALDHEGETFTKYNVKSLPYGVLLNANGAIVWEGHPADLKANHIRKYLRKYQYRTDFNNFFKLVKTKEFVDESYEPEKDFEFEIMTEVENDGLQINEDKEFVEIKGTLKQVLAHAFKVNEAQVSLNDSDNLFYKLHVKKGTRSYRNLPEVMVRKLKLKNKTTKSLKDVYVLDFANSNLWDTNQIDWAGNPTRYLIGTADIKADNISVKDMSYILGKALDVPVLTKNVDDDDKLHDWNVHYKYFNLMVSSGYKINPNPSRAPF